MVAWVGWDCHIQAWYENQRNSRAGCSRRCVQRSAEPCAAHPRGLVEHVHGLVRVSGEVIELKLVVGVLQVLHTQSRLSQVSSWGGVG